MRTWAGNLPEQMHAFLLLNEQLFKRNKIWVKPGWTFRKRRRVRSWKHRHSGWKHSWNVPCTSPSAGGVGVKVLSCTPREIWQREFISGRRKELVWAAPWREVVESTWNPAELSLPRGIHKSMGCDCYFRAQKNASYFAPEKHSPTPAQTQHFGLMWHILFIARSVREKTQKAWTSIRMWY